MRKNFGRVEKYSCCNSLPLMFIIFSLLSVFEKTRTKTPNATTESLFSLSVSFGVLQKLRFGREKRGRESSKKIGKTMRAKRFIGRYKEKKYEMNAEESGERYFFLII